MISTLHTENLPYKAQSSSAGLYYRVNNTLLVLHLVLMTNSILAPILFNFDQLLIDQSVAIKIFKYIPISLLLFINQKNIIPKNLLIIDKILFFFAFFYCISTIWSPSKTATLGNSLQFLFFILYCNYIFNLKNINIILCLKLYFYIIIICTYLLIIIQPNLAFMSGFHEGLLRGVFVHKNLLGATISTFLPFILFKKELKLPDILLYFIAIFLLYLSDSSTSIIAVVLITALSFPLKYSNRKGVFIILAIALFALSYFWFNFSEILFKQFDKSADMTGRLILWENLLQNINEKPYFGWGYFGFWKSKAKAFTFSDMDWVTGKAHNAFIDVMLSGGYFLLIMFTIFLIYIIYLSVKNKNNEIRTLAILIICSSIILSITEMNLIEHNNINLFIIYFLIHIIMRESKLLKRFSLAQKNI